MGAPYSRPFDDPISTFAIFAVWAGFVLLSVALTPLVALLNWKYWAYFVGTLFVGVLLWKYNRLFLNVPSWARNIFGLAITVLLIGMLYIPLTRSVFFDAVVPIWTAISAGFAFGLATELRKSLKKYGRWRPQRPRASSRPPSQRP